MRIIATIVVALWATLLYPSVSYAEVHCASTVLELRNAVASAQQAGASPEQEIRLVAGDYDLSGDAVSISRSDAGSSLSFEGGFAPGCAFPKPQIGAQYTVLRNLASFGLGAMSDVALRDATILAVTGASSIQGSVTAERVVSTVEDAQSLDVFVVSTDGAGDIALKNILVTGSNNNCGILAVTFSTSQLRLEHVTAAMQNGSGICLDGIDTAQHITLVNSIAETAAGSQDLLINTTASTSIARNVYGTSPINLPAGAVGNSIAGWEIFAANGLSLSAPSYWLDSVVVDKGDPTLTTVSSDVFGNPRLYGRPDIGAIETDRIFGAAF